MIQYNSQVAELIREAKKAATKMPLISTRKGGQAVFGELKARITVRNNGLVVRVNPPLGVPRSALKGVQVHLIAAKPITPRHPVFTERLDENAEALFDSTPGDMCRLDFDPPSILRPYVSD